MVFELLERAERRPSLGSDNHSGVHPEVMRALVAANGGHVAAYGQDAMCEAARAAFAEHLGAVDTYFVFNGTGANVLGLQAVVPSYGSIVCAATAHIQVDECAAPEKHIGCKILPIGHTHGKLRPVDVERTLIRYGDQHFASPRAVSISQPTELGTLYTLDELRALSAVCQQHRIIFHMDGARLVNAAAALNCSLRAVAADVGVDVLSFGGTKNGLMFGEAVVFLRPGLAPNFSYLRKQGTQLGSKQRFVAAQFLALLHDDLWRRMAQHANGMAQHLARGLAGIDGLCVDYPVQTNAVFITLPRSAIKQLRAESFFYLWDEHLGQARLMTTFDTDVDALDAFCASARRIVQARP